MPEIVSPGIEYYRIKTDFFDRKDIRQLKKRKKDKGVVCLLALYCEIYKDEGYFVKWSEDLRFLLSEIVDCNEAQIEDIVRYLVERGFFEKCLLDGYGILTSASVQETWLKVKSSSKGFFLIEDDFWLHDKVVMTAGRAKRVFVKKRASDGILLVPYEDLHPCNSGIEKKSKVKKSKEKYSGVESPRSPLGFEELIRVYGRAAVQEYTRRLEAQEAKNGRAYSDRPGTMLRWMRQDGVPEAPSYDIDYIIEKQEEAMRNGSEG